MQSRINYFVSSYEQVLPLQYFASCRSLEIPRSSWLLDPVNFQTSARSALHFKFSLPLKVHLNLNAVKARKEQIQVKVKYNVRTSASVSSLCCCRRHVDFRLNYGPKKRELRNNSYDVLRSNGYVRFAYNTLQLQ